MSPREFVLEEDVRNYGLVEESEEFAELQKQTKDLRACTWFVHEVKLDKDIEDWQTLSDAERLFLSMTLAFFAASDGIVNANLLERFMQEVKLWAALAFYRLQAPGEIIHSWMYSKLLETYVTDPRLFNYYINAIHNIESIKEKALWAQRWIKSEAASFAERVVAFAAVEGIFFSGSFAAIFYLCRKGKMPGLQLSNILISRDEGLHLFFACALFQLLWWKPIVEVVHRIVREAVDIEKKFNEESIRVDMIGMSAKLMKRYIEFTADGVLVRLGYPKLYNSENPFPWMKVQGVPGKTNFFEANSAEYIQTDSVPVFSTTEAF